MHELDILDVGCASGVDLVRLVGHDADPPRIHGIDLRADVLATARRRLPSVDLLVANAAELPHPDRSMDLVLQSTARRTVVVPPCGGSPGVPVLRTHIMAFISAPSGVVRAS